MTQGIEPAALIASADEIDNRMGPIPGMSSDRIARELRNAAALITKLLAEIETKERDLAALIARYYRQEIGLSMQQAEHWAKENYPLAVHHRVRDADSNYQVVVLCERFKEWNENPFDVMRRDLERGLFKPAGTYPPTAEIHAYRDPAFVVEKLKTASRGAGGPG